MTLKCVVAMVKSIKAGEGVSYGHPDRATRHQSCPAAGRIRGRRLPCAGRTNGCAHQWTSSPKRGPDLHGPVRRRPRAGSPRCGGGDEAILFGPGDSGEPTAQDWADLMGTIHYEVVTSPRVRVARTYVDGRNG